MKFVVVVAAIAASRVLTLGDRADLPHREAAMPATHLVGLAERDCPHLAVVRVQETHSQIAAPVGTESRGALSDAGCAGAVRFMASDLHADAKARIGGARSRKAGSHLDQARNEGIPASQPVSHTGSAGLNLLFLYSI